MTLDNSPATGTSRPTDAEQARAVADRLPDLEPLRTGPRTAVSAAVARKLFRAAVRRLAVTVVEEPTGVPGGLYDNALFEDGHGHVLVYRPTAEPPRSGRVHPVTLPAVELAVTTHVGEHGDIDVTYGELGTWVVANALAVAGPVRETYLVGPRDAPDPDAWRTEIGWPVFRLA